MWARARVTAYTAPQNTRTVAFEPKTFEGYVRMKDAFTFPVRGAFPELGETGGANQGLTETPGRCLGFCF